MIIPRPNGSSPNQTGHPQPNLCLLKCPMRYSGSLHKTLPNESGGVHPPRSSSSSWKSAGGGDPPRSSSSLFAGGGDPPAKSDKICHKSDKILPNLTKCRSKNPETHILAKKKPLRERGQATKSLDPGSWSWIQDNLTKYNQI